MIVAILQARCSSTRLPNKVLKPLLGEPMIRRQIERIQRARLIDELVVATSSDSSDDALANVINDAGINVFRGSLEDVLDRVYRAAVDCTPDYVVRLTADCPLIDPEVIDEVIRLCQAGNCDYSSNGVEPTYPDGLDVEVMRLAALEHAWREAMLPSEREHVTPFIYHHPELFSICHVKNDVDFSHLRWTVDNAEDFQFVTRVYEALYPVKPSFNMQDVLALLELHPDWTELNRHIGRNEGMKKSLLADQHAGKVTAK
ncbi:MAG: glycosyltransferase family protein [Anaerolineae bacterium]|nr:glycosyltransferase family protein [Rhodocyclaceae bacterium]MCZ2116063.1 glycosyltransferase family protein [Anaerolineae bacterium]